MQLGNKNVLDVKSLRYLCMVSLPSGACGLWRTLATFEKDVEERRFTARYHFISWVGELSKPNLSRK